MEKFHIKTINDSIVENMHFDNVDKKMIIEHKQDIEPILDHIKERRENGGGVSREGDLRYAGSLPEAVVREWLKVRGLTMESLSDRDVVRRLLNDPDNSAFRIWGGRV